MSGRILTECSGKNFSLLVCCIADVIDYHSLPILNQLQLFMQLFLVDVSLLPLIVIMLISNSLISRLNIRIKL